MSAGHESAAPTVRASGSAPVAAPGAPALRVSVLAQELDAPTLTAVRGGIAAAGGTVGRERWLSPSPVAAVEVEVSGAIEETLRAALVALAGRAGVDVAVRRAALDGHGRRLVVLDVDSTLIRGEVVEMLAARAGREEEVAALTRSAMRGEIDFAQSLRARVATLAGLPVGVLDEVAADLLLTPGAATLVAVAHHLGWTVALVSGGFAEVVAPLAASLGVTHVRANALEVSGGHLTGRTTGPVVDRAGKARALREIAAAEGVPLEATVAVGDGANDLDMLAAAGIGVAFNATPVVRAAARAAITTSRLDTVLHLLGVSRAQVDAIAGAQVAGLR